MYDKVKLWYYADDEAVTRMERGNDATPIFAKDAQIGCKWRDGALSVFCLNNHCTIEATLPKVLNLSNIEPLQRADVGEALQFVCEKVGQKAEFMRVSYVELFNAWDMARPPIEYFGRLADAGRYMPRQQVETTLYFGRLNKRAKKILCFYDKSEDCKQDDIMMQGYVLRYELRLHGRLSQHGITTADTLTDGGVLRHLCDVYKMEYHKIKKISLQDMEANKDYLLRCLMAGNNEQVQAIIEALRASRKFTSQQIYRLKKSVEKVAAAGGRDDLLKELDEAVNGTKWE